MLAAIHLDDQFRRRAEEIHDIRPNWRLAAKTRSVELLAPQFHPQALFGFGEVATKFSRER